MSRITRCAVAVTVGFCSAKVLPTVCSLLRHAGPLGAKLCNASLFPLKQFPEAKNRDVTCIILDSSASGGESLLQHFYHPVMPGKLRQVVRRNYPQRGDSARRLGTVLVRF